MYSPIQYCVWKRWIKIPETYGRRNSNDLCIHPNIEKWMESTRDRWSSSWNFPSIHYITDSRGDPDNYDWNTMWTSTIHSTCVLRMSKPWEDLQEDSRTDIGRFSDLDQKRIAAELTYTSRTENGIMSLRTWRSTSVKADIPCFMDPVLSNEDLYDVKEMKNCLHTSVVIQMQSKWFFARLFPSINSVSTER